MINLNESRHVRIQQFFPSLEWLPKYNREEWRGDWPAGLTVGIMLIPQGMAYAMIAGLPVVYGLYAALLPQIVYGFLGTSRHLAVGPVAMDSLLVAAGLSGIALAGSEQYIALAILLALLMGIMQVSMGMLKLGFMVNFLSKPVISGFTSAAALIIGLNQMPHILGISSGRSNQLHKLVEGMAESISKTDLATLAVGLSATAALLALKRWAPKIPAALVVVAISVLTSWIIGFESAGIRVVGVIPEGLPGIRVPSWDWSQIQQLLPTASPCRLWLSWKPSAWPRPWKIDTDTALMPIRSCAPLGWPMSWGLSSKVTRQQVAFQGLLSQNKLEENTCHHLDCSLSYCADIGGIDSVFYHLPNAVLAAIVMVAVAGLIDLKYPQRLWKQDRIEALVLVLTTLITLTVSLPIGIGVGVLLALAISVYKMMIPHVAVLGNVAGVHRNVERFAEAKPILSC